MSNVRQNHADVRADRMNERSGYRPSGSGQPTVERNDPQLTDCRAKR